MPYTLRINLNGLHAMIARLAPLALNILLAPTQLIGRARGAAAR
jgi:hypothetical protein